MLTPSTRFEPVAGLLALLLPGAGHVYLGQVRRGILTAVGVLGLFVSGLLIGGLDAVDSREDRLWFLGQALVGPVAFATDALHQRLKDPETGMLVVPTDGSEPRASRSLAKPNEIGTLYATIAGMLNLIAALHALFPPPHYSRAGTPAAAGAAA